MAWHETIKNIKYGIKMKPNMSKVLAYTHVTSDAGALSNYHSCCFIPLNRIGALKIKTDSN